MHVDETLAYTLEIGGYPIRLGVDIINMFNAHYAYRIANGFVGSSYAGGEMEAIVLVMLAILGRSVKMNFKVSDQS